MADARDRAEPQHHLLIDVEDGDQQQQRPQQRGAVILTGLGIGAESAGVIVADHDDEARTEDGEKRLEPVPPAVAGAMVSLPDGAEGALDVAEMGRVENGGGGHSILRRGFYVGVHWLSLDSATAAPTSQEPLNGQIRHARLVRGKIVVDVHSETRDRAGEAEGGATRAVVQLNPPWVQAGCFFAGGSCREKKRACECDR